MVIMANELEEKIAEYRILEQQHEAIIKRREELITRLIEMRGTVETVEEMEKKKNDELLVPLGSGIFIHAKADFKKKVMAAIGSDIIL